MKTLQADPTLASRLAVLPPEERAAVARFADQRLPIHSSLRPKVRAGQLLGDGIRAVPSIPIGY